MARRAAHLYCSRPSPLPSSAEMSTVPKSPHRITPGPKPDWLKVPLPAGPTVAKLEQVLRDRGLHTVCEEAKCPNMGECWASGTATFMVLGDTCTRGCRFCAVKTHGKGTPVDADEPKKVADACIAMGLRYVVLTM